MNNFVKIYGMGFLLVLFLSVVSSALRKIYQPPDLENLVEFQQCLRRCYDPTITDIMTSCIKPCKEKHPIPDNF
ncbi:UNVERIFIED_CONTAM: hypothetical protein RMT77_014351 [Armadillidium vulgare]